MSCEVDYDGHVAAIRQIVCLRPAYGGRSARTDALLEAEVPRLLLKVEQKLADELRASGVEADVAAHSAMHFVGMVVEHYCADRVAA